MKKQAICLLAAVLCAGSILAGCGPKEPQETDKPATDPVVTESTPETTAPTTPETTAPTTPETTAPTTPETTAPAEAPSGNFIDLDNLQFSINGKTYTLGKTTLQQLIDDGVPFRESDLANANNNLNKNSQSPGFRIDLAEYWSAQVYVLNDTDGNKTMAECYINEVTLPMKKDKTQNILTFACPQDMTIESLKASAGEPTDSRHYDGDNGYYSDTLKYTKKPTRYYGYTGYVIDFTKGKLDRITIKYLP